MKLLNLIICLLISGATAADFAPTPMDRKNNRPPELWRDYMHGVIDDFATPILLRFAKIQTTNTRLETTRIQQDVKAFNVKKGERFLSKSLPINADQYRGKTLRFFYWMRGFDTGAKPVINSYHDAPQIYILVKDSREKTLTKNISHNGAVGTYPWHCYYKDVYVPAKASTFRIQLENLNGGVGQFTRFSFELVNKNNTYFGNERQDPETGSVAAFPRYEPINFHFFAKPFGTKYVWNFMRGTKAGMIGQPYDLTTTDGLRQYFQESVKTDLDQMNHGIMYFPMRYHQAKKAGVLPPMPENWLQEISRLILADQNPDTGYWGTKAIPQSMSVTFHYLDMLFAFGIERSDSKAKPDPMRLIASTIPRAEQMVKTTLNLQSHTADGKLAAWNTAAYNFTATPDASRSKIQLGSTMNAIRLLRLCRQFVNPELQKRIDESIQAAYGYALQTVILPTGVFKQTDLDAHPTKNSYWADIVSHSHYLEPRRNSTLPLPTVTLSHGAAKVTSWPSAQNSVRIYAAQTPSALRPENLLGIIQKGEAKILDMDPYIATRKMFQAQVKTWGGRVNSRSYASTKLKRLPRKLPVTSQNMSCMLLPVKKGYRLYAVSVNWYGEESLPVELK